VRTAPWVIAWIVIGVLAMTAFFRLVAWDVLQLFVILNAFTLFLYLPAVLIAVAAVVFRRWWLAAASIVVVAAYIGFVLPELTAAQPIPASVRGAATLRLFDANVTQYNLNMTGYAAQIRAFRPDVVMLEEVHTADEQELASDGALAALPNIYQEDEGGSRGVMIASRYPIGPVTESRVDGLSYLWRTTLELPSGLLPLWLVHTTAPVPPDWHDWSRELAGVDQTLQRVRPRPLLMVGDFNATWNNKGFRDILATGLTDAAAARGQALDMTWSQDLPPLPPIVRIDHILTSPAVVVTTIRAEPGPGSQHRDLLATVAVVPPSRRN
jgi:endonuclease/exonuclease/phosphatase (EEP) superfamily protein YafD